MAHKLAHLFALCALALGCSSAPRSELKFRDLQPDIEPVTLDASFTSDEKDSLKRALDRWNAAAGKFVQFRVVGEVDHDKWMDLEGKLESQFDGIVIAKISEGDEDVCGSPDALACAALRGQFAVFNTDKLGSRDLELVALHELGHHLGLPHIPIRDSLMYPVYLGAECIDVETLKTLATVRPSFRLEDLHPECAD